MELSYTDLVVIGGGPAGMMCALQAAQRGKSVVLLEPNDKLGRKLRITGKGRCNLCNNCDVKTFMANVPGDGRFLYSALNRFSPADTIAFFESHGLPLKTERGNRVFPQSDNANDVANLMASLCRKSGVQVLKTAAKQIIAENGAVLRGGDLHGRQILSAHRLDRRRPCLCRKSRSYGHAAAPVPRPAREPRRVLRRDAGLRAEERDALRL